MHRWAAVMIMDITYGIRGSDADPYIQTAVAATDSMGTASAPGTFLVDAIPILRYVPDWVPGAGFKRKAREWDQLRQDFEIKPFLEAKRRMAEGSYTSSLATAGLEKTDPKENITFQEDVIRGAAVTSYGGGTDTVVAALGAFVLQMLLHPEIQRHAQQQLDAVLGHGELLAFSDEPSLPYTYITAIVRETIRHDPATPLAIPHLSTEDDTHNGYYIPKGTIVIANGWSILHNPETYPDPETYKPERFLTPDDKLDPSVRDPATAAFGYGRRICPGRHVAISALWMAIASILAVYDISPEHDEKGNPLPVKAEWSSGPSLFYHPLPFKCTFTLRSKAAEESVLATAHESVDDL